MLRRLREGDEGAFETLIERHDGSLRRVARTFVRTVSAAEEVVQETWLAVINGLDRFEGRSSLRSWIFGILVNKAKTRAVRDARNVPFSALEDDDRAAVDPEAFGDDGRWRSAPPRLDYDPQSRLLNTELREHLVRVIDELPPQQRIVLTLRDLVGLSGQEVSELLEISEVNQRVLLHRGRSRVRAALTRLLERSS